jgi:hypothetical protein
MATKKTASPPEPQRDEVQFNGPAGITTIPLYEGMIADLPPLWQVRYEDLLATYLRGDVGDQEFAMRLGAIFTHLPDVAGNQRIDPRVIDRGLGDAALFADLIRVGVRIMPFITPKNAREEPDSPNA